MKFTNLHLAQSYAYRAFETAGTSLEIIMLDCPYYYVCSRREAAKLIKKGYELATIS